MDDKADDLRAFFESVEDKVLCLSDSIPEALEDILERGTKLPKDDVIPPFLFICVSGAQFWLGVYTVQLTDFVHEATRENNLNAIVTTLYIGKDDCLLFVNMPHLSHRGILMRDLERAFEAAARETIADPSDREKVKLLFLGVGQDDRYALREYIMRQQEDERQLTIVCIKEPIHPIFSTSTLPPETKVYRGPHETVCICQMKKLSSSLVAGRDM